MRLAALLAFSLLVATSIAGQVLAQEPPAAPPAAPEHALADKLVELLGLALAAAVAALLELVRRWLRERLSRKSAEAQRDAAIAGVEKAGDPATKAAIKDATAAVGVAIDRPTIARATSRVERLNGGAA